MATDDQIDVRLGATDAGLKQGLESAASVTQASTSEMEAAFAAMSASIQAVMEKVNAALDGHLKQTKTVVKQEKEELTGLAGAMATVKEKFAQTQEELEGFAGRVNSIGKLMGLLGEVAAVGYVGEQITELARGFAEWGDQMEKTTAQTGLSVQAVQELQFAGKNAGLSAQEMDMAMVHLSRTMANAQQGNQQAENAFKSLGISMDELKGKSIDEVLAKIADAFQKHADGANKAALAQQIFGRSGFELVAFLDKGSAGIEELRKKAEELGIVMGEDDVKAAAAMHESFVAMDAKMQALKLRAGEELAPAFIQIADAMGAIGQKGGPLDVLFQGLAIAIKAVVSVAISFLGVLEEIGITIGTIASVAITAATGNFSMAWDLMKKGLDDVKNKANETDAALHKLWQSPTEATYSNEGHGQGESGKKEDFSLYGKQSPDDPQKLAEAKRNLANATMKAELDMVKENLAEGKRAYEEAYHDGLINTQQYYDGLLAITQGGLREQIKAKQQDVSQAQNVVSAAQASVKKNGEAAVTEARAKLVTVTGQLAVLEQQLANSAVENAAKREAAERKVDEALAISNIDAQQKIAQQQVAQQQAIAQERYALGQITKERLKQLEQQLQDETYQIDAKALQEKIALYNTDSYKNPVKVAELNNQLEQLEAEHVTKMTQLAAQEAEAQMANAKQAATDIESGFEKAFASFADRTKTAKQAFTDFLTSIDQQLVQLVSKDLFNKLFMANLGMPGGDGSITSSLTSMFTGMFGGGKKVAGAVTGAEKTASTTADTTATTAHTTTVTANAASFTGLTTSITACIAAVHQFTASLATGSAGSSGGGGLGSLLGGLGSSGDSAGAFGFTATGVTGSADAVASGAMADGGGMSALMGLASFDVGTPYVPNDMIAQIHQGEAIVPAHLNSPYNPGGVNVSNQFVIPGGVSLRTQSQVASMAGAAIQQALRRNG